MHLINRRLNPAEAEIRIVGADGAAATGVTGRILGPRCEYSSTVEVAYYVRPASDGGVRVIIPEPSLWSPQTPFLYEAILQTGGGEKVVRKHGLRGVRLTSRPQSGSAVAAGLRVNGRSFRIDGVRRAELADAAALRAAGVNTLWVPVSAATVDLWSQADRLGFFVIGVLDDAEAVAAARELKHHPSALGWIVADDFVEPETLQTISGQEPLLGVMASAVSTTVPPWVQFLAASESMPDSSLPWLLLDDGTRSEVDAPLGRIRI